MPERCFRTLHKKAILENIVLDKVVGLNGVASGRSEMQCDGADHPVLSCKADTKECVSTKCCQTNGGIEEIIVLLYCVPTQ